MNDDTQGERFQFQQMDCYQVARDIAARLHRAKIADAELRDEGVRNSVFRPG